MIADVIADAKRVAKIDRLIADVKRLITNNPQLRDELIKELEKAKSDG